MISRVLTASFPFGFSEFKWRQLGKLRQSLILASVAAEALDSEFNISFKSTLLLYKLPLRLAEESILKNKNKKSQNESGRQKKTYSSSLYKE